MTTNILSPVGTYLASRRSAGILRAEAVALLGSHQRVIFDLSSVQLISASYADELFGILARDLGLDGFVEHIYINGASAGVLRRVASALKERLSAENLGSRLSSLVAAKHNGARQISCH